MRKLNIVHCVSDEKFIDGPVIERFEYFNNLATNYYVIVRRFYKKPIMKFRYVKKQQYIEQIKASHFLEYIKEKNCDIVILHSFGTLVPSVTYKIPRDVKVVWFAWGYDIYKPIGFKPFIPIPNLYGARTQQCMSKGLQYVIKDCKEKIKQVIRNKDVKRSAARIDYFSGVIPQEYHLMEQLPYFNAKQLMFTYSSLPKIPNETLNTPIVRGRDIMIGNSGDMTNNHLDIFESLKKLDLHDRKVYVPLSYGGTDTYRRRVKAEGLKNWGNNFIALDNFMEISEYKKILSNCGFRIFGHERQQAMGNISMSWQSGCKIFLSETSMAYQYYSEQGVNFYTLQHDMTQSEIDTLMDEDEAKRIRAELYAKRNPSKALKDLEEMLNSLLGGVNNVYIIYFAYGCVELNRCRKEDIRIAA